MIDYAQLERAQFQKNVKDLYDLVKQSSYEEIPAKIRKRIENHCDKSGLGNLDFYEEMKKSIPLCSFIATDPKRQKLHETACACWMKSIYRDLEILPTAGAEALFLTEEGVAKGGPGLGRSKSLDFRFLVGNRNAYASHKFIKDDGGAQDNQYNDQANFITQANVVLRLHPGSFLFVLICDGNYFLRKNRMQALRAMCTEPGIIVGSHDEIPDLVKQEITRLLDIPENKDIHAGILDDFSKCIKSE